MALSYAFLTPDNAEALLALLPAALERNWNDDFLRAFLEWRYLERPEGETIMAMDGGRCVAVLDSFRRSYRIGADTVVVRETCEWFCLPEYRAVGAGLRVMQRTMSREEPILSTGGTEATLALLPRLGWQRLPDVENFVLPVTAGAAAATVLRERFGDRAQWLAAALRRLPVKLPHRRTARHSPGDAEVRALRPGEVEPPSISGEPGLMSLLTRDEAGWLARAPREIGSFVWLGFRVAGRTVGLSCSRIEASRAYPTARILHLQAEEFSPRLATWMLASTAEHLVGLGSGLIRARFSHPALVAALEELGFLRRPPSVALWWPAGGATPKGPAHLVLDRADDGLIPLPG